jgi:hypothetical protein
MTFFSGEVVALSFVMLADLETAVPAWCLNLAYALVGVALLVLMWFTLQFGWLVTVDKLYPTEDDSATSPAVAVTGRLVAPTTRGAARRRAR